MIRIILLILIPLLFSSCDYFKQDVEKLPIARVNDSYLYEEDIKDLINETATKEDSALIVNNYINRWATKRLLLDQARINLSEAKLAEYNKLVQDYKSELYTEAYKNSIVLRQLDSTINEAEFKEFYELNKENFKLNDELFWVRYIHVEDNYTNFLQVRDMLKRFNDEDKNNLNALGIQFKAYNFNDSIWVKKSVLFGALPILMKNSDEVLKKSNFIQLRDSLGVYLVKIENILKPNDIAPLSYIKPTIEQIILNKRKLELTKKLEKDITKDAIKNSNFEIYKDK